MKLAVLILLIIALAIPGSASSVVSWTQTDISGHNLTLNYTSEFNVAKDDILGISIINIGNGSENDTITVNKINVSDTTKATGSREGSWVIVPGSNQTIDFILNMTTNDAVDLDIKIHYNVSSENKTLNVTAKYPGAPKITSWGNSKTNNSSLNITINETESVTFNFTANQTLTSWSWKLKDSTISTSSNTLTYKFNSHGSYKLNASGSNSNGSTQIIVWNISVLEKEVKKKNATILDWYPEVVDYVYVNGTVNETIEYSITTAEKMAISNWTVNGTTVTGNASGNTYYYNHTWDNDSRLGAHTIIFKGSNNDTRVEFRWYVNVYRIGEEEHGSGSIFDIIDDALENHVTDIKIRMFKYKIAKHAGKSEIAAQKVNQLHDEIAKRQMTREALRAEFKAGIITAEIYTAAMKQVQREAKYNSKLAEGCAKISIEDLKDDKSENDFKKISEMETKNDKRKEGANSKGKEDTSIKGNEDASTKGKSKGNNKDNENKNNGRGKD
jgi:hypothetical protein